MHVRLLRRRRHEQLVLLSFIDEVAQWQHQRGRGGDSTAWVSENPAASLIWEQAFFGTRKGERGGQEGQVDGCIHPDTSGCMHLSDPRRM